MANPDNPQTAKRLAEGKSLGGRPTEYRPEYCESIIKFMTYENYAEEIKVEHVNSKGDKWVEVKRIPAELKFIEDWLWENGISAQAASEWKQRYPEFGESYARARQLQTAHLLKCGFAGLSDPTMTKFAAVNLTDLRDKTDLGITVSADLTADECAQLRAQARQVVSTVVRPALPPGEPSQVPDVASDVAKQSESVPQEGRS